MARDRRGVDLWRQVSETLAKEISGGMLESGERLPASSKLATRFGVHQHTVLKAISHLQEEGLVRVEQGRGTFVVEHPVQFRLGKQTWFEQNLLESQHLPTRTVLSVLEMPAPDEVAVPLGIKPGAEIVRAVLLGEADGVPVYCGRHHFSTQRFPGIGDVFRAFGAERSNDIVFSRILKRYGFGDFRRRAIRIRGRLPDADEARWLQMGRSTPLVETRITLVDQGDRPLVYGLAAYCSDRVELAVDL